jgi:hypothetical protein
LASIPYKPPRELLPFQLYTLGISYLKAGEDEKAAVILTTLTSHADYHSYQTAENLLLTGVAWFRIENFTLAESYFDEVLKVPEGLDTIQYQAQARLWKAVLAKRSSKEMKAPYWLRELIDHHPHSDEASWINSTEGENENSKEE